MHRAFRYLPIVWLVLPPMLLSQEQVHTHDGRAPTSRESAHHEFFSAERGAIERGDGFGMAMVADQNVYPGPMHVLELKTELQLTADQQAGMEKLYAQMKERALSKGRELLEAEGRLGQMFAAERPEAELREQALRAATVRAELRWVHLAAHAEARKLLSPEQLAMYGRLRVHSQPAAHRKAP